MTPKPRKEPVGLAGKREQLHERLILVPSVTVLGWIAISLVLEIVAGLGEIPFPWTAFWVISFIAVGIFILYPIYILCRFMLWKRRAIQKSYVEEAQEPHDEAGDDPE